MAIARNVEPPVVEARAARLGFPGWAARPRFGNGHPRAAPDTPVIQRLALTRGQPQPKTSGRTVRNKRRVKPIPRTKKATGTSSPRGSTLDSSRRLLNLVEKSLDDDKAEDVVVIDLSSKSSMADFMVIATGRSQRQLHAMAEHLAAKLKALGIRNVGIEGARVGDWVLLDGGDVVVHLFRPEVRRFYNLEKMWGVVMPEPEMAVALA